MGAVLAAQEASSFAQVAHKSGYHGSDQALHRKHDIIVIPVDASDHSMFAFECK